MSGLKELFGLNLTRIILAFVFLLLIEWGIRGWEEEKYKSPAQMRLITQETDSIQALQHQFKQADGYKIAFLGDSVAWGSSAEARETIPFYLEYELRSLHPDKNILVYNFAYKGYGISENLLILNTLRETGVDLIIYGVNTNWFNRSMAIQYTNAAKVSPQIYQEVRLKELGINIARSKEEAITKQISFFLTEYWALYRNRSNIAAVILGKSLAEKIFDYKYQIYDPALFESQQKYWREVGMPWDKKNLGEILAKGPAMGGFNLAPQNPQVEFYRLFIELIQKEQVQTLFYTTPVNHEMFDLYGKLDHSKFRENLDKLKELSMGVNFVDYSYTLPERFFADGVHLLKAGHQELAREIAGEITRRGFIND